jgi:4-hydroxyphenylacetate 3-monooxygenase
MPALSCAAPSSKQPPPTSTDYAVGFICDLGSPNLKFICRTGFAGRAPVEDYPLANRFDEIDTLVIFDDVLIPWENVLFYRHTKAASFIRATLHRYSASRLSYRW